MSQPTSLSAGLALGRQTCFVKYNIYLLACSAPGQQNCWLAHKDFCLKNWANKNSFLTSSSPSPMDRQVRLGLSAGP
jgi:uncharacterized membrane protein YukC